MQQKAFKHLSILNASSCQPLGEAVIHPEKDKPACDGGASKSLQCEQMALINAEALDRISLDGFYFLNETFVCKCIVYKVVTSNSN